MIQDGEVLGGRLHHPGWPITHCNGRVSFGQRQTLPDGKLRGLYGFCGGVPCSGSAEIVGTRGDLGATNYGVFKSFQYFDRTRVPCSSSAEIAGMREAVGLTNHGVCWSTQYFGRTPCQIHLNKKADECRRLGCLSNCQGVQITLTFTAHGPFGPLPSVYDTRCPSEASH